MTISDRNRVLGLTVILETVLLSCFAAFTVLSLSIAPERFSTLRLLSEFAWEPKLWTILPAWQRVLAICGALGLYSLGAGLWTLRAFKKSASYEILFFAVFIASIGLECSRSALVWAVGIEGASFASALISRIAYFGRWTGALALFTSSLYAAGLEYEKADWALIIILFLGLIMASLFPLNSGYLLENFTLRPGYHSVLLFVWYAALALSLANYFFAALLKGSRDYLWMGLGLVCLLIGRDILFFLTDGALALAGIFLLSTGTFIFLRRCFRRSLWQ